MGKFIRIHNIKFVYVNLIKAMKQIKYLSLIILKGCGLIGRQWVSWMSTVYTQLPSTMVSLVNTSTPKLYPYTKDYKVLVLPIV